MRITCQKRFLHGLITISSVSLEVVGHYEAPFYYKISIFDIRKSNF